MENKFGWIDDPDAVDAVESEVGVFGSAADFLTGSGKGKIACLHESFTKIGKEFCYTNQGNVGSCVAASKAGQVDTLKATEIANGERELYTGQTAIEPIYFGARVVIGGNKIRGDGAVSAYAAKYVNLHGTLVKTKYGNIDLTEYSVDRCKKWGSNSGFPKTLESISKEHLVLSIARVKSWEELRDSIANGFPVSVGSRFGFSSETDDEGFCKNTTTWNHDMFYCAVDDDSPRKGALCVNSWGRSWLKIRKRKLNQPDGTFWVDADMVDKHMANGDAWSISGFQGFKRPIDSKVSW
jgi:hypothetical protein